MPSLVTSPIARKNLRWDARRKLFVGWRIDVYVHQGRGRPPKRYRTTFPGENEARAAENRLRTRSENIRLGLEAPEEPQTAEIRALFGKRLAEIGRSAERIRAARVFSSFLDANPGLRYLADAKEHHFEAWAASRRSVAPSTVNRETTHLITAFARAPKILPGLDGWRPPQIPRPKFRRTPREGVVGERDAAAIAEHLLTARLPKENPQRTAARPVAAAMFRIGWLLGLRIGEIRRLVKSDFRERERTLRVVRWKTGTVSMLEFLPDEAVRVLAERAAVATGDLLFDPECSERTLEDLFRRAIRAAGLTYGRNVPGGVTFHSLRHSFTTRMIRVADLATARSFTGHSDSAMVAYYSHASPDSRRAAMERLYGAGGRERLRDLYDRVREGRATFEEFLEELGKDV